jgi:hypothetical protein
MTKDGNGGLFRPGTSLIRRVIAWVLFFAAAGAFGCVLQWTGAAL